jgi:glucose/arabinose dehydrogenase
MPDGQLWANHNGRDNMIDTRAKNERPLEDRPAGVTTGADGALYVSDDLNGRVYRIGRRPAG